MISGVVLGLVTLTMVVAFVGIALWAYSPARKSTFERAARLPFADDGDAQ